MPACERARRSERAPSLRMPRQKETGHHTRAKRRMLLAKGYSPPGGEETCRGIADRRTFALVQKQNHGESDRSGLVETQGGGVDGLKSMGQSRASTGASQKRRARTEALPLLWQIHRLLGGLYKKQKNIEQSEREFASARRCWPLSPRIFKRNGCEPIFFTPLLKTLPKEGKIARRQSEAEKFGGLTPPGARGGRLLIAGKVQTVRSPRIWCSANERWKAMWAIF